MPHQQPPPTGAYVEDPASGRYYPIEQEASYPNGNIAVNGQMFPHESGMEYYRSTQQQQQPQAPAEPPGIHQVATAPDGVPYYQSSDGKYWTKNADGTYSQQTIDPASWATQEQKPPPGNPPPSSGTGLIDPWGGQFTPPPNANLGDLGMPQGPVAPTYKPPPAFEKPTYDEAINDPGFKFVQEQGQRGLENSAAARGLLNSGGTLKDISTWNQGLADTQYQNVWNRNLDQYKTNYQTQFADPYQHQLDQFNPQQQQWMTNMQAQQRANEFSYMNAYDQYKFNYQQWLDRLNFSKDLAND